MLGFGQHSKHLALNDEMRKLLDHEKESSRELHKKAQYESLERELYLRALGESFIRELQREASHVFRDPVVKENNTL